MSQQFLAWARRRIELSLKAVEYMVYSILEFGWEMLLIGICEFKAMRPHRIIQEVGEDQEEKQS